MSEAGSMDRNDTFGAMLIGAFVTMAIYGITTLQVYFYYMTYPDDVTYLKILAASVWTLDTIHVIFMCHAMHQYLIIGFVDPSVLLEGTWSLFASLLINVILSFGVQCFFLTRMHTLCPEKYKWWVSSIVGFILVAHFAFGVETVAEFYVIKTFTRLSEANFIAVLPFAVTAILSDIMIAAGLCILLRNNRSDYEDTNYLISTLIMYAITRCLLTSVIAIVETVVFVLLPTSFYSFAIDFVIGKLWANSFLASLNSRQSLRDRPKRSTSTPSGETTSFRVASRSQQTATGVEPAISLVQMGASRGQDSIGHIHDEDDGVYIPPKRRSLGTVTDDDPV